MTSHLLIAHGSPDPRHAAFVRSLAAGVSARGLPCAAAFLEHDRPAVADWLAGASGRVVSLGLLLAPGFHAQVDVPRLLATAPEGVEVVDRGVLGSGPWLAAAADQAVASVAADPHTPVLLVTAGSARIEAEREVAAFAAGWAVTRPGAVRVVPIARLAAEAERTPAAVVLPHLVAPGVIGDRIAEAAGAAGLRVTPVLGAADLFVDALVHRLEGRAATPAAAPGAVDMAV